MTNTAKPQIQSPAKDIARENIGTSPLAIYVHWPFCKKKCPYCDFNSHVRENVDQVAWKNAFLTEISYWYHRLGGNYHVSSIFFGGGTPSLMPPETAAAILNKIASFWPVDTGAEITLEANPTSVEAANFADLNKAGINRVSLGIQSLQDRDLQFLGREHSVAEALHALETAQQHFNRVSFDLIYALPNQTPESWESQLKDAIGFGTNHLSLYQLTIEENTAFHHAYHAKKTFTLPDENDAARLYEHTQKIMNEAGLPAYETSNHAKPGEASRHNLTYWRYQPYLGIGPGAHGRVDIGNTRTATCTIYSPERWMNAVSEKGHGLENEENLSANQCLEEQILMGLRLVNEGVTLPENIWPKLASVITDLQMHQLIIVNNRSIHVTAKGALLINQIAFKICEAIG